MRWQDYDRVTDSYHREQKRSESYRRLDEMDDHDGMPVLVVVVLVLGIALTGLIAAIIIELIVQILFS